MAKLTLTDLVSLSNETSVVNAINNNNAATELALENTLSRDGTSPNEMEANLDMNDYRILNLPDAILDQEPVTKAQLDAATISGISDSDLLAIAALSTTSFGRNLLTLADAAAARTNLGLVIGTNVQAYDAELAAIAGLTSAADKGIYFTGSGTASTFDLSSFARTLLDDTTASGMRSTLGLATEVLTSSRTYYVRTDGSDSNDGLTNTSGGAFKSVQKAIDTVASLIIGANNVTIKLADGTYSNSDANVLVSSPWLGTGTVTIEGNTTTPGNVILSGNQGDGTILLKAGRLTITGMRIEGSFGVCVSGLARLDIGAKIEFGTITNYQIYVNNQGFIWCRNSYSIVGDFNTHIIVIGPGVVDIAGITISFIGSRTYTAYAYIDRNGTLLHHVNTFDDGAGSPPVVTGSKYYLANGGGIFVNGAGTSYLPGSTAGTFVTTPTSTGWYA